MSLDEVLIITKEENEIIRKSYGRSDEEIEEDIQVLKEWMKKQLYLPQDEDETRFRLMLFYNKFSLEKTKKKLDYYYSARNFFPELFANRDMQSPAVSNFLEEWIIMPLPNLTSELHRIYLIDRRGNESQFDVNMFFTIIFSIMDIRTIYDKSLGDRFIINMKHAQIGHIMSFTLTNIKNTHGLIKKAYSDRIAGVHIVNMPSFANTMVLLLKSVLSAKLANRVFVHKDFEEMRQILSPEVLPKEFGGSAGSLDELYDKWKKFFKSKNDWLKELGNKKSDETKRVGEPITSDMFGINGSFRKLDLD